MSKQDKLIVITGASSGIGKAAAQAFSKSGYPLLLLGRHVESLLALNLPQSLCLEADVTQYDQLEKSIKKGKEQFGLPVCLINSAGVLTSQDFLTLMPQEHEEMIAVNFKGLVHATQIVLKEMLEGKEGTILNISSLGDRQPIAVSAVYCATKAAVKNFTEGLRKEYGPQGIRFCNLAPAFVETPMWQGLPEFYPDMWNTMIKPEEFANILLWIYEQPSHICISDLVVTPTKSPY